VVPGTPAARPVPAGEQAALAAAPGEPVAAAPQELAGVQQVEAE